MCCCLQTLNCGNFTYCIYFNDESTPVYKQMYNP